MPSGVVLDAGLSRALLWAGFREGLLPGDEMVGDGVPQTRLATPPPEHVVQSAFEQVVIGRHVFLPSWVPYEWHESLASMGVHVLELMDDKLVEVVDLSPDLVLAMMSTRGITWSRELYEARVREYLDSIRAFEAVAGGKSSMELQIQRQLARVGSLGIKQPSSEGCGSFRGSLGSA